MRLFINENLNVLLTYRLISQVNESSNRSRNVHLDAKINPRIVGNNRAEKIFCDIVMPVK